MSVCEETRMIPCMWFPQPLKYFRASLSHSGALDFYDLVCTLMYFPKTTIAAAIKRLNFSLEGYFAVAITSTTFTGHWLLVLCYLLFTLTQKMKLMEFNNILSSVAL